MNRIKSWLIGLGLIACAVATGLWFAFFSGDPASTNYFDDSTSAAGIDFTHRNGEEANQFTILESLGGGVALLDFDQDGLLDIFLTGGGHFGPNQQILGSPNRLFRNEGGWRFRDVTADAGLPTEGAFYSHGGTVGDYDNDGWPDLLVTGYGRLALYRNDRGKFTEVTEKAGLLDKRPLHWSTSAVWADLNGDGWLDLFVCHYCDWSFANDPPCPSGFKEKPRDICPPEKFKPLLPALYLNQKSGTFQEVSESTGLVPGHGLGVLALDADNDGKIDLYVANDGTGNRLYLNKGQGKFVENGVERGVAYNMSAQTDGSMGIAAADYNRSGFLSMFVTNFQNQQHALFRNLGNGAFQHAETGAGLGILGRSNVGFGAVFLDFDLDGSEDLFFTQGHVMRFPEPPSTVKQRPVLLHNRWKSDDKPGQTRFEVVTDRGGPYFSTDHMGRGVACGDLDNDGGIDLVISHTNEPATLLRNVVPGRGHWLGVDLVGKSCRDAIGARLTLEVAGQKLTRQVLGGGSYLSSSDRRIVFGLGKTRTADKLTVRWPSGQVQSWSQAELQIDCYSRLVEGEVGVQRQ